MSGSLRHRARHAAPRALALAGSLLFGALAAGCAPRVAVTVVNASREPLTELRVAAEDDSTLVPDVAPGGARRVRAAVHGEDAIVLRGRIGGRPLAPMMAVYVEDGDRVRLAVDPAGYVSARAGGGPAD